jgi:hypothetical protein
MSPIQLNIAVAIIGKFGFRLPLAKVAAADLRDFR